MAKFKCNHSGCIVEFTSEQDIKTMRVHSEYSEIVIAPEKPKQVKQEIAESTRKKE